jgi:hypothetical protein
MAARSVSNVSRQWNTNMEQLRQDKPDFMHVNKHNFERDKAEHRDKRNNMTE